MPPFTPYKNFKSLKTGKIVYVSSIANMKLF